MEIFMKLVICVVVVGVIAMFYKSPEQTVELFKSLTHFDVKSDLKADVNVDVK
jgi:hypothetical protein